MCGEFEREKLWFLNLIEKYNITRDTAINGQVYHSRLVKVNCTFFSGVQTANCMIDLLERVQW